MAIFSDVFRSQKDQLEAEGCWASCLLGTPDIEARIELAIRMMPPPIAHGILRYFGSQSMDDVLEGLAAFWAVCTAGMSGWTAVEMGDDGAVVVEKDGLEALILPVALDLSRGRIPQDAMLERMIHQLEAVIMGRRFVVHIKQALPDNFDPMVLVQPVQNWVYEIDKGQWSGGYAIYEDDDVSLELCLLDQTPEEGNGRMLFHVPPLKTEPVLRMTIPAMVNALGRMRDEARPLILLMLSNEPWQWNPGMLQSVLYGRCTSKWVESDGTSHSKYVTSGLCLMANDAFKGVGSIWWIAPSTTSHLVSGVSHVNPWAGFSVPAFPGTEYQGDVSDETSVHIVKRVPECLGYISNLDYRVG